MCPDKINARRFLPDSSTYTYLDKFTKQSFGIAQPR